VGGVAEIEGGVYIKLRVKNKDVKVCYLSNDPACAL